MLDASLEVRGPIVYATLIIIVAAVPIFFLEGLTGAFFRPLALAYTLAVLASMVVALTVTPALALILLRKAPLDPRDPPVVRVLKRGYKKSLEPIVDRPWPGYVFFGALIVVGAVTVPFLGQSLLPDFKERDFLMHWVTQPGTSAPEEVRISQRACQELLEIEGVRNCGAHIGQAYNGDEVYGVNFGENWISVDPAVDYDATLAKVQESCRATRASAATCRPTSRSASARCSPAADTAVVVRLYGDDLQALRDTAEEINEIFLETDGAIDEHISLQVDVPQLEVTVDLDAAQAVRTEAG